MSKDNNQHLSMWNGWSGSRRGIPVYDLWLQEYLPLLKYDEMILDLGCGIGANTRYLIEQGFQVLSCDYSLEALKNVKEFIKGSQTKYLNMNDPFPFNDDSFKVIVADISLHYFLDTKTIQIMKEIRRILKPDGILLARVSSIHDTFNVSNDDDPDSRYHDYGSYGQRYMNESDLKRYFGLIGDFEYREVTMVRDEPYYRHPKKLYQLKVCKR